jgi:WD40 repeat protein
MGILSTTRSLDRRRAVLTRISVLLTTALCSAPGVGFSQEVSKCGFAEWSPQGHHLSCSNGSPLSVVSESGKLVGEIDRVLGSAWHPSGESLVVARYDEDFKHKRLVLIRQDASVIREVTGPLWAISHLSWHPNGSTLLATGQIRPEGHPMDVLMRYDTTSWTAQRVGDWTTGLFSPDGERVLLVRYEGGHITSPAEIAIANQDMDDARIIGRTGTDENLWTKPLWSPDGQSIAMVLYGEHKGKSGRRLLVYRLSDPASGFKPIGAPPESTCAWLPVSSGLVCSAVDGPPQKSGVPRWKLVVIDAVRGGKRTLLRSSNARCQLTRPAWSDSRLVYTENCPGPLPSSVHILSMDDRRLSSLRAHAAR